MWFIVSDEEFFPSYSSIFKYWTSFLQLPSKKYVNCILEQYLHQI